MGSMTRVTGSEKTSFVGSIVRIPDGSEWIAKVFEGPGPRRFIADGAALAAELAATSPATSPEVKAMLVGIMRGKSARRRRLAGL
jgi:hypothetical protein